MPTSTTSAPFTWTLSQSGPQSSVAVQAFSGDILYRVDTALPAETDLGHPLKGGGVGNTVGLEASENLYIKSISINQATVVVTV